MCEVLFTTNTYTCNKCMCWNIPVSDTIFSKLGMLQAYVASRKNGLRVSVNCKIKWDRVYNGWDQECVNELYALNIAFSRE